MKILSLFKHMFYLGRNVVFLPASGLLVCVWLCEFACLKFSEISSVYNVCLGVQ